LCAIAAFLLRKQLSPAGQKSNLETTASPSSSLSPTLSDSEESTVAAESVYKDEQKDIRPASEIKLSISQPVSSTTVTSSSLTLKGTTSAKAEVYINDIETTADASGNFSAKLSLDEGENYIVVTAVDTDGNVADAELTVTYNAE